jgi:L-2-hydroxyglutarate oxidase LhgO
MSQITRALEKDLDIQLNTPVQTIDYTGDVIVIKGQNGQQEVKEIECDRVIVSVPLGCLKS